MVEDYQENYGYGWVSIYRSVMKHWIWDDPVMFQRWITILLSVNHEPTKYKHYYSLVDLEAGQSVKSIRTWAELMRCSTKTAVKTFDLLEDDGMIKRETLGKGKHSTTLITVENYKQYQKERKHNGDTKETQEKHNGDTDNNDNNYNNDNKDTPKPPKGDSAPVNWKKLLEWFNGETKREFRTVPDKAKRQVRKLIETYGDEWKVLLTRAVQNAKDDEFMSGDGKKYLTLEYITRPDQFEKWSSIEPKKRIINEKPKVCPAAEKAEYFKNAPIMGSKKKK